MKKYSNFLYLLIVSVLILLLYGCGTPSPAGNGAPARQSQTTMPNITGGNALNMTIYFPVTSATTPAALISASTSYFEIWVRTDAGWLVGQDIGYAKVVPPVGGGMTNIKVDLNPYVGPATVEIWGYNQNGNGNSFMWNNINIQASNNPSLSVVVVEMGQGVNVPAATPGAALLSPDNVSYPITKIFVDTSNRVGVQGYYELGIQTTIPGSTSAGIFSSLRSSIPGGLAGWWGPVFPNDMWAWGTALNPYQLQADIVDGNPNFYVDVPNAAKTLWNRYDVILNFQPGGVPTNTPIVRTTFIGTLDINAIASSGAGIVAPAAPGTVILNIPNAAWTNNVAPPPNAQGVVLF